MHPNDPVLMDDIFYSITSPLVLMDISGRIVHGNPAGRACYQALSLMWQTLPASNSLSSQAEYVSALLHSCQVLQIPVLVAIRQGLLKIVPAKPLGDACPERQLFLLEFKEDSGQNQLDFFKAVGRAVNSSLILEDIFEALGETLYEFIPYQETVIVILDETQNGIKNLVRLTAAGGLDIVGEHHSFAGYEPLIDRILRHPRPLRIDLAAGPDSQPNIGVLSQSTLFSVAATAALIVPLVNKGVVIGLIALSAETDGESCQSFSAVQEDMLDQVSAQLAIAVENARLYWQTQAQAGREFLINQLTRSIRQSLDIDVILATAATELGKVLGVSRCFICYMPQAGYFLAEQGLVQNDGLLTKDSHHISEISTEVDKSVTPANPTQNLSKLFPGALVTADRIFGYQLPGVPKLDASTPQGLPEKDIFLMRQENRHNPFILNDVRDCSSPWLSKERLDAARLKSLAVIPILVGQNLVGTISLHQCDTYRSWVSEDIELLRAMAEHLGVALNQAQLFQVLDQKTQDLEKTLDELQQAQLYLIQSEKMAVLGQFVAGIAHEVNTPLGTMLGNNATIEACFQKLKPIWTAGQYSGSPSDPSIDAARLTAGMESLFSLNRLAGSRIQEIVRNLRNFARLDESELKLVDLHEGIDSTLLLLQSSLDQRITIIRDYSSDLPPVQCFPGLLNQVFMNLIVNASHAIQDRLADKPHNNSHSEKPTLMAITIRTVYESVTKSAIVTVQDTGKGIAPENINKVFDPGFTTKGVGVGTGLGLALCYRIVEKHQGRIAVESQFGVGATFTVQVPLLHPLCGD